MVKRYLISSIFDIYILFLKMHMGSNHMRISFFAEEETKLVQRYPLSLTVRLSLIGGGKYILLSVFKTH